jgi:hypothetical protein
MLNNFVVAILRINTADRTIKNQIITPTNIHDEVKSREVGNIPIPYMKATKITSIEAIIEYFIDDNFPALPLFFPL